MPDHYLDKTKEGVCLLNQMISDPEHFWTPIETINWTKQQLKPKFKPGTGFHYSDTNYELLGLIIENVTGKNYRNVCTSSYSNHWKCKTPIRFFIPNPKLRAVTQWLICTIMGLTFQVPKASA
ncbi:MAG: serine hydrolase [Bacteroidales bacterium]|nr:serine hydrolase [Bacteroidales bacterium]